MSYVDHKLCPLHNQGIPFMWYAEMYNGSTVYEYDDRKEASWGDGLRAKYMPWLDQAQQEYFRRNISVWKNIRRIGLELFDNLFCLFVPSANHALKETKFDTLKMKDIKRLGIMGNQGDIYLDTSDGVIDLGGGRKLNVFFVLEGRKFDITSSQLMVYHDLIERHYASYEFDVGTNKAQTPKAQVTAWAIGHKGNLPKIYLEDKREYEIQYEMIYVLPLNGPGYLELGLTSIGNDAKLDLHLTYLANDDIAKVLLKADKKEVFHIVV